MIQARLSQIDEAARRLAAAVPAASALDAGPLVRPEQAAALDDSVVQPLRKILADVIERLGWLETLVEGQELDAGEWDALLDPDEAVDPPPGRVIADDLWRQVTDVCFAARGELRRVERALAAPTATHDDRIAACEAAQRKLRRALAAVLQAIGRARNQELPELSALAADLDAAIAVRRTYAKFRRSLVRCDPADAANVRRALRLAAVALAILIGSGDFADVRAQDRRLILGLQHRVLAWARGPNTDDDGRALYQDLVTAADLLRAINLRQELAAHDLRMLGRVAAALADDDPARALAAALPALRPLEGRDDALDDAITAAARTPATAGVVAALRPALPGGAPAAEADPE